MKHLVSLIVALSISFAYTQIVIPDIGPNVTIKKVVKTENGVQILIQPPGDLYREVRVIKSIDLDLKNSKYEITDVFNESLYGKYTNNYRFYNSKSSQNVCYFPQFYETDQYFITTGVPLSKEVNGSRLPILIYDIFAKKTIEYTINEDPQSELVIQDVFEVSPGNDTYIMVRKVKENLVSYPLFKIDKISESLKKERVINVDNNGFSDMIQGSLGYIGNDLLLIGRSTGNLSTERGFYLLNIITGKTTEITINSTYEFTNSSYSYNIENGKVLCIQRGTESEPKEVVRIAFSKDGSYKQISSEKFVNPVYANYSSNPDSKNQHLLLNNEHYVVSYSEGILKLMKLTTESMTIYTVDSKNKFVLNSVIGFNDNELVLYSYNTSQVGSKKNIVRVNYKEGTFVLTEIDKKTGFDYKVLTYPDNANTEFLFIKEDKKGWVVYNKVEY